MGQLFLYTDTFFLFFKAVLSSEAHGDTGCCRASVVTGPLSLVSPGECTSIRLCTCAKMFSRLPLLPVGCLWAA